MKTLLARIKRNLYRIAFRSDLEATRLMLALGAIFVGAGFLSPATIFPTTEQIALGSGRHTYALMAGIAPEWVWGWLFLIQGSTMLWSLVIGSRNTFLMWVDSIFGALLWSVAIGACYLAYWPGLGDIANWRVPAIMGLEVAGVMASWWVFIRYNCQDNNPDKKVEHGED